MTEPILAVRELHAYHGESHVLQGVSLDVRVGECAAILGRNGAGKTTTISAISGLLRPRRGSVQLRGREVAGEPPHRIARAGLSLVPQGRRIFADLTARENLELTARGRDGGWELDGVLALFPALRPRLDVFGDQLSGGEQQMLAIGRALMRNPRVLLLDEPSEGLAPKVVAEVGEAIGVLRERGLAILLVEQNLALATGVAQRVYVMSKGTMVFSGAAADLASSREIESRYLGV